jgi:hypothetical protein
MIASAPPSKTPLRSIHAAGGTWVHHHPAAACVAASALRVHALRATFCSPQFAEPPIRAFKLQLSRCQRPQPAAGLSLLDDVLQYARVLVPSILPFSLRGPVVGVFDGIFSLLSKHTRPGPSQCHGATESESPATLPTVPQPARTAPSVVESLSFLHHAPSPGCPPAGERRRAGR